MIEFDASQQAVLALDPGAHASVLGAPGTGKTSVLVEAYAELIERAGWNEEQLLVVAPNRLVSAALRGRIESRVERAIGGTPVRTAVSLAFAVLARAAAVVGEEAPRLLTGTVQDEQIAEIVEQGLAAGAGVQDLPPEVLRSPEFRAELRELWRVVDDFALDPAALRARLEARRAEQSPEAGSDAGSEPGEPEAELVARWCAGLEIVDAVSSRLAAERPDELTSSALMRAAAAAVRENGVAVMQGLVDPGAFAVPRLLLVDDAQELGEGDLALLAACAAVGSKIWVFGDPDAATGAFQGERTAVLTDLTGELRRRGGASGRGATRSSGEQRVVLGVGYRHRGELHSLLRSLVSRIGAAGAGQQRAAVPVWEAQPRIESARPEPPGGVQFARTGSTAEQLGAIAHRLRARHLGIGGLEPLPWTEMAVICRTRAETQRVSRALAIHQVPTGVAAGGIVLREHQIVRELIRLLQHALGIAALTGPEVLELAGGVIGGLDPVAIRRLRGALLLHERREARAEAREPRATDAVVLEAFEAPGPEPVVDSPGGRALRRLGIIAAAGTRVRAAGGTARETLWALWDGTRLAAAWQEAALAARGARADEAHRSLDAVLGLFFALQRHEEQRSEQPIDELLDDLLQSAVPEDSLAQRSEQSAVTVTTPQGAIGREFALTAVIGVQDGAWPNLRARGSLLGTAALERWLRGGAAQPPSRRDTMHDELRLFVQACSRARDELLVVAVADEDQYPSAFFGLGRAHEVEGLPSARLTLRGATAEMRRRLTAGERSSEEAADALRSIVALAREGVPGAHPDDWYGVLPPSTDAPLIDLESDHESRVPVSPSQLERAETCPLDWAIGSLGGGTESLQASLGTLVHHALETAEDGDAESMLAAVRSQWGKLPFEADWESERAERTARGMVEGLARYLRDFAGSGRELLASEALFAVPIGRAVLRGMADRLELDRRPDGAREVTVLDLKTGRTPPTKAEAEEHAQMQAYQLGVTLGAFVLPEEAAPAAELLRDARSGGARLLYVHPDATGSADYLERVQQPLSEEAMEALRARVTAIAEVMAAADFEARIEHHCSDPHQPGNCRLHIIPPVSRA